MFSNIFKNFERLPKTSQEDPHQQMQVQLSDKYDIKNDITDVCLDKSNIHVCGISLLSI